MTACLICGHAEDPFHKGTHRDPWVMWEPYPHAYKPGRKERHESSSGSAGAPSSVKIDPENLNPIAWKWGSA